MTTRSRNVPGAKRPSRTSEYERVRIERGGPRKSIHAVAAAECIGRGPARPEASCAATTGSDTRRWWLWRIRRIVPPRSFGNSALPTLAPLAFSASPPPSTRVSPSVSGSVDTSVVASAIRGARWTARYSALSFSMSLGSKPDGSVNWMSTTMTFAPSRRRRSMTSAWRSRGNGQRSCEVVERLVVDRDDRDVLRLRRLRAHREASVDRPELGPEQRVGEEQRQRQCRHQRGAAAEQQRPRARLRGPPRPPPAGDPRRRPRRCPLHGATVAEPNAGGSTSRRQRRQHAPAAASSAPLPREPSQRPIGRHRALDDRWAPVPAQIGRAPSAQRPMGRPGAAHR